MDVSRLDGHSLDPQAPVLARLMADMPELFSEGKLDPQKLRSALGEDAFAGQERYDLTWNGKSECFKKIQETTTKTLRPCREESVASTPPKTSSSKATTCRCSRSCSAATTAR